MNRSGRGGTACRVVEPPRTQRAQRTSLLFSVSSVTSVVQHQGNGQPGMTRITAIEVHDVRFPTSRALDGSDAMNPDPDYSAAYVVLGTDRPGLEGHGLTFTIGPGNELCGAPGEAPAPPGPRPPP